MRQLRRWKGLWRRSLTRSHKSTSMGPSRSCWNGTTSALQPEEITLKRTRVLRVYSQLKSGNSSYAPRIYIYLKSNRNEMHIFLNSPLFTKSVGDECPTYETKLSDGEIPVMLELWGMRSTPLLLSLPGSLWPGVVVPYRTLSMCQIELNCVYMLNWITWNRTLLTYSYVLMETMLILKLIFWIRMVWLKWIAWNRTVFDKLWAHAKLNLKKK